MEFDRGSDDERDVSFRFCLVFNRFADAYCILNVVSACSDSTTGGRCWLLGQSLVLFLWLVCTCPVAFAHPDLLQQIEDLTEQLEQQPGNVDLLLKRGDLQRRVQNWSLARADFERVREVQADNKTIDWFEGRLDVESDRLAEGILLLSRFLQANPEHTIALQNRAQAYLLLQQPLLAAQDFAVVIRVSDRPAPSLFSANALALVVAGADYYSAAMAVVQSGLVLFPAEIMLTGIATDLSLALSELETASNLIKQLPPSIQKLQQWQTRQALLDCQTGFQERAALWFESAGEVSSSFRSAQHLLSEEWMARLAADPNPKNCQAAAVEKLQQR